MNENIAVEILDCRICGRRPLIQVLDLGDQPWGNDFRPDESAPKFPLRLMFCPECNTPQLSHNLSKEFMFSNHTYVSGTTNTLRAYFDKSAKVVAGYLKPGSCVLDIGSNDGSQLEAYRKLGFDILGVEPAANIAKLAMQKGIPTEIQFFNLAWAKQSQRIFDLINASGVFFHLEELHSACEAVSTLLSPDGIFCVHFLYMKSICKNLAFDQIYHEHLLYYNLTNFSYLMRQYDLEPFDVTFDPIHGGSLRVLLARVGSRPISESVKVFMDDELQFSSLDYYLEFADKVKRLKEVNMEFMARAKESGKKVFGLGAPVKGNTLLNYFGFTKAEIECLTEINEQRQGLVAPGSNIPVMLDSELDSYPDVYYVLAWNFKDEILKRYWRELEDGVEFYFPINPELESTL